MKTNNSLLNIKHTVFKITSAFCLLSITVSATPTLAEITFMPPPDDIAPKKSVGGASRDTSLCGYDMTATNKAAMKALLPKTNIGLTLEKNPSIWVYIPPTDAKKAFFTVRDEQGKQHYQTSLALPEKSGVMEIKLDNLKSPLEIGKNYQWSLVMICTQELEPDSPFVSGWIRRIKSESNSINQPSIKSASNLAIQGIWYDSVSVLAQLRRKQPNNSNFVSSWQALLKSVDLNEIAEAKLANQETNNSFRLLISSNFDF